MARSHLILLAAAVALLALAPRPAAAKITDAELRKDERVFVPLDEPFGFSSEGRINITLTGFLLRPLYDPKKKKAATPQVARMGILVTTPYGELQIEDEIKAGKCPLDSEEQVTLFTFDAVDAAAGTAEQDFVLYDLLEDYQGGEFVMYFANCEADTAVDFKIRLALYNQKGARQDFLPVGQDMLPLLYFVSPPLAVCARTCVPCTGCVVDWRALTLLAVPRRALSPPRPRLPAPPRSRCLRCLRRRACCGWPPSRAAPSTRTRSTTSWPPWWPSSR
jgi:hypothetical protein